MGLNEEIKSKGSISLINSLKNIHFDYIEYRDIISKLSLLKCNYKIIREFEEIHDLYYDAMR